MSQKSDQDDDDDENEDEKPEFGKDENNEEEERQKTPEKGEVQAERVYEVDRELLEQRPLESGFIDQAYWKVDYMSDSSIDDLMADYQWASPHIKCVTRTFNTTINHGQRSFITSIHPGIIA